MALEAAASARVDQATFVVTRRRCMHGLEEFGAMGRLLAMFAGGGVVAAVRDAKQGFDKLGRKLGCV